MEGTSRDLRTETERTSGRTGTGSLAGEEPRKDVEASERKFQVQGKKQGRSERRRRRREGTAGRRARLLRLRGGCRRQKAFKREHREGVFEELQEIAKPRSLNRSSLLAANDRHWQAGEGNPLAPGAPIYRSTALLTSCTRPHTHTQLHTTTALLVWSLLRRAESWRSLPSR